MSAQPDDTLDPWEQQPTEGPEAFEAFAAYRDMGLTRSTAKVRTSTGKDKRLIERWSSTHGWVARCQAWDREVDRERRLRMKERAFAAMEGQAAQAQALRSKTGQKLLALDVDKMTIGEAIRGFDVATRVEHAIFGVPSVVEVSGPGGSAIEMMSTAEMVEKALQMMREADEEDAGSEGSDGSQPGG